MYREDIVNDITVSCFSIPGRIIWLYREHIVNEITIWCVPISERLIWFYREDIVNDITYDLFLLLEDQYDCIVKI